MIIEGRGELNCESKIEFQTSYWKKSSILDKKFNSVPPSNIR